MRKVTGVDGLGRREAEKGGLSDARRGGGICAERCAVNNGSRIKNWRYARSDGEFHCGRHGYWYRQSAAFHSLL